MTGPLAESVVPQWVVEEAWRRAWDAELVDTKGRIENIEGVALRRLSLRVRERARQIARGMMDMMHPARVVLANEEQPEGLPK